MKLLLLLILSVTTIYAQESILGVDIPKNVIVDYDEWDNEYWISSSNTLMLRMKESPELLFFTNNYIMGTLNAIGNTNIILRIQNYFWKDSKYQNKSENDEFTSVITTVYIKNNNRILKREIESYFEGYNDASVLYFWSENDSLSFIIDNLNENSTLRIKDFAGNIFEYSGEELKPIADIVEFYKQLKQQL